MTDFQDWKNGRIGDEHEENRKLSAPAAGQLLQSHKG